MKNINFKMKTRVATVLLLAAAMFTVSCDGGSSSGGGKVRQNEYLGKLPSIYASYQTRKKTYEDKVQEQARELFCGGKQNADKLKKLKEESDMKLNKMEANFEIDAAAEVKALTGREIPVSYSENLKKSGELFYIVATPVKLVVGDKDDPRPSPKMVLKFTAIADIKLGQAAHIRMVDSNGLTLAEGSVMFTKGKQAIAGEIIKEENNSLISSIVYYPAEWENFAGIEFCTQDELSAANKERRKRHKDK